MSNLTTHVNSLGVELVGDLADESPARVLDRGMVVTGTPGAVVATAAAAFVAADTPAEVGDAIG